MEFLFKFRWLLFPIFFFLIFFVSLFYSIPKRDLKQIATNLMSHTALVLPPSKNVSPLVKVDDVSTWRISGLSLSNVNMTWPAIDIITENNLKIDSLKARIGLFSYLLGTKNLSVQSKMYDGYLDATVDLDNKNNLKYLSAESKNINLSKILFIPNTYGLSINGILQMQVDIKNNKKIEDANGTIKLSIKNSSVKLNNLSAFLGGVGGAVDLPLLSLGEITIDLDVAKKEVIAKTFKISNGDLEAEITANISLNEQITSSTINATGWFSLKESVIESNETLKTLYSILPQLSASKINNNKVGFKVNGTLKYPNFNLEIYTALNKN